jgi:hypothetical protein
MDHYSITIQNFGVLQINFSVIVRETRHHAQADITFHALVLCSLFSRRALSKHGRGVCSILLASVGGRQVLLRLLQPHLAFQSNRGGGGGGGGVGFYPSKKTKKNQGVG